MRRILIPLMSTIFLISLCIPSPVSASDFLEDLDVGIGINQGTENEADETFVLSLKTRLNRWEYGLDICMSEQRGGGGDTTFGFIWSAWLEEFKRPDWQDYGLYLGAGAGFLLLEDDLTDWPAGPFIVLGWDLSNQAGIEGKLGYFGENYWGTALCYWYFE